MSPRPPLRAPRRPPVELLKGLAVLAEPPTSESEGVARSLGLQEAPSSAHYADLFLFQLYPYASVHLGPEGMMGGEAAARVAGFWRAVGYDPPPEPDHLAALLGLYAALCARETESSGAEARLTGRSRWALLHEHLMPWIFPFLDRVGDLTGGPLAEWARLLEEVLRREVADGAAIASGEGGLDRETLPVHLMEAPPLPDPRREGGEAFLDGLLAPVRTGFIVTRADLAGIASRADLGLRAGERRYALEHLLAQEAGPVLEGLAGEARREDARHRERERWLGVSAAFLGERARRTAELLQELAGEAGREPRDRGSEAAPVGNGGGSVPASRGSGGAAP